MAASAEEASERKGSEMLVVVAGTAELSGVSQPIDPKHAYAPISTHRARARPPRKRLVDPPPSS